MTTRFLVIGALVFVGILLACDEDRMVGPQTTGSIAVNVVMDPELREAHANMVDQVRASLWQDGARGAQRSGQSGDSVIFDNLVPGNYDVVVDGLTSSEVEYFGNRAGVSVTAGNASRVTIGNYALFTTQPNAFASPTTDVPFHVSYGAVAGATGYVIEWGTGLTYSNTFAATGTSARISVDNPGTYNVRVRANNQWVTSGAAGDTRSIEVQTDTIGNTAAAAMNLGVGVAANGTYDRLNILPLGDVDWFVLDLSPGDRLTVHVASTSLSSMSELDPVLAFYDNPAGSPLAADNSAGEASLTSIPITTGGTHYLRVSGQAASLVAAAGDSTGPTAAAARSQATGEVGHYELEVLVEASAASPITSTITASPTTILADGASTAAITVQVKDAGGSNLSTGGDLVALATTAGTLSAVTDNGDGTYAATLTPGTSAATATITGTLNSVSMSDDATVDFTSRAPDPGTSTITASPTSIPADGASTSAITVQLKDAGGSNLTEGGTTVAVATTAGALSSVTDNNDGTYTATLTASSTGETATITGTVNAQAISDDADVIFSATPLPDPGTSTITASPTSITADGSSTSTITIQLKYANGSNLTSGGDLVELATTAGTLSAVTDNADGSYTATLTASITSETATITGALNGVAMTDGATVMFTAIVPDATTSTITASPTAISADGTSTSTITVRLKDAGGNNLTIGGDNVALATTAGTLSAVADNSDGTYSATLTSSTSAEIATITGTLNSVTMSSSATVMFTTEPVPDPTTSTIAASPESIPADGSSTSTITVQLKYANSDNLTTGGDLVELASTLGTLSAVTDNSDGTYTATLTAAANAGVATLSGTLNGVAMTDSASVAFTTLVQSVHVAPAGASISGVGTTQTFTAEARDGGGNPLPSVTFTWTSLNPAVATIDAATGEATAVASGQVTVRAEVDGVAGYGLLTVADPDLIPVNLWADESITSSGGFYGVWAADSSHAFAVGLNGAIQHFDGTAWTPFEIAGAILHGVWGADANDVYGAGVGIIHWDGSSWGSPYSVYHNVFAVWGSAPNDVYAVGDGGAIDHYDGTQWSSINSGADVVLVDVWGSSATDIFAVGDQGTILHWDGSSWTPMVSGTSELLSAIWGFAGDDVFAGGENGIILHYDGSSWAVVPNTTGVLRTSALWGSSAGDAYSVGGSTGFSMMRFDGAEWILVEQPRSYILFDAFGIPGGDLFAAGVGEIEGAPGTYEPAILRGYRGATVAVTPDPNQLTAIDETVQLTAAAADASANPIGGVTFTWSSDNEAVATVDTTGLVTATGFGSATITATAPGGASGTATVNVVQVPASIVVTPAGASISGVGTTQPFTAEVRDDTGTPIPGAVVTWTSLNPAVATIDASTGEASAVTSGQVTIAAMVGGVTGYALLTVSDPGAVPVTLWSLDVSPTTANLWGIWGTGANDVWASGLVSTDMFLHFDGMAWSSVGPGTNALLAAWGASPDNVWAVGAIGLIVHYDGSAWSIVTNRPTTEQLYSVWGTAPDDVHAVGDGGTILHYDGTSWNSVTSPTSDSLRGVWGTSANDAWAVGVRGTIFHYDGAVWTVATSPTTDHLFAVWGTASNNVWAVGNGGTILHFNGTDWAEVTSPTTSRLYGAWGADPNSVFAVGAGGSLVHFDGAAWSQISSGTTVTLAGGVWGTSNGHVFAVGNTGTILRGTRGATVSVTPASIQLTALGETLQLSAAAQDAASGPITSVSFTWSSDNNAVAPVGPTGLVTAVSNGTANITATAPGGASGSATVTVAIPATSVVATPTGAALTGIGTAQQFSAEAYASGTLLSGKTFTWTSLNPNVATIDPSTGEATAVASGQTAIQAQVDGVVGYALLTVAIPGATPVNLWVGESSPTTNMLSGTWGSTDDDVWAVGDYGTLIHFDGVTWNAVVSPTTVTFRGVWGTGSTDVWAAGDGGRLIHYDGSAWDQVAAIPGSVLWDVWASAPTDVFAVGDTGIVLRYDGATPTITVIPGASNLRSVWGTSGLDVFAADDNGDMYHFDGNAWTGQSSGTTSPIHSIWGTAADNVYAVASDGGIIRYNGSAWSPIGGTQGGNSIWGTSTTDIYTCGGTQVSRFDGFDWLLAAYFPGVSLGDVWGTLTGNAIAVGDTIFRGHRGATVSVTPGSNNLTAIDETVQLSADALDAGSDPITGVTYTWSSDNEVVATVDANGLVAAVDYGTANITATAPGGAADTVAVTVDVAAWTWISGSASVNQAGVYGTKGTPSASNVPGGRKGSASWIDASGDLWLFGGTAGIFFGGLNDLWRFDGTNWTWISGSSSVNQVGVYGTKGTPSGSNVPGGRAGSVSWIDASGDLWLFGGSGFGTSSTQGWLNDLWRFDGANWTWISGSSSVNQAGVYGIKGTPSGSNVPGTRNSSVSWIDASGDLWLFGGNGYDASATPGRLNDLWRFDGTNWTWISGSSSRIQGGTYGTKGTPSASNVPGARETSVSWIDASGDLWLFGGNGYDASATLGHLNDLWRFDGTNWTWISGSSSRRQAGTYGTLGTPSELNVPGARIDFVSWIDASGDLWLFGGNGYDASATLGDLNDLWRYRP